MTKQILTIIKGCRSCPKFSFQSSYIGGIEFICDLDRGKERCRSKLIPDKHRNDSDFIHEECQLEDMNEE